MPGELDDMDAYINQVSGEDVIEAPTNEPPLLEGGQNNDAPFSNKQAVGDNQQIENKDNSQQSQQPTNKAQEGKQPVKAGEGAQQQPPKLQRHVLGGFVNEEGDIVTEDGALIAKKGVVRRVYEENGRLKARMQDQDRIINELQSGQREGQILNGIPQRYGLDNNDVARALDLAGRMKKGDVLSVAKEVVAMAAAAGHNVTDILGQEVGDSVDMRAIKQLLDQRLGPIEQQRNETTQDVEARKAATIAMNKFFNDNTYADIHQNEIAAIAKREGTSPQRAYNDLMTFVQRNNLDPSQPLGPQVQERMAQLSANGNGGQQQQNVPGRVPNTQQKPMPNGAATTRLNGGSPATPQYADPDDDWGTIIRQAQQIN